MSEFNELLVKLDEAYKDNNVTEINRINSLIMGDLGIALNESALDFEFMESIKGKTVYKNLKKFVKEDSMDSSDVLKLLSSLVTHLIIESSVRNKELNDYPIKILNRMIDKIVSDKEMISDAKEFLHSRYGRFI
jgi:hypothetical protein